VLVFDVADYTFGINVAKVREVLPAPAITSLPQAHPSIRGVFKLRNQVIPCVSLLEHLGITSDRESSESTLILTDLNQQQTAFLVDDVERIHRLSWENILAVPGLEALAQTPVTALARCGDRLIVMLDFEMVLDDVTDQYFRTQEVDNPMGLPREDLQILMAEDSPTVRQAIRTTLANSGYANLKSFENGAQAWTWLEQQLERSDRIEDIGDLLICDVEMPQVDGLHLTKKIKGHPVLKQLPVLLYSSIVTPENRKKGNAVGADAQVSKPELTKVVQLADELIFNSRRDSRAADLMEITRAAQAATKSPRQPSSSTAGSPVDQHLPEPSTTPTVELSNPSPASPAEVAAPADVDERLWRTFHRELTGRADGLRGQLRHARAKGCDERIFRETARILHTIKSAAMVIPVDPITRATHLTESLMEVARGDHRRWPDEGLHRYLAWLDSIVSPLADVDASLADAPSLEAELNRLLASAADEPTATPA
jgi:two-component system chemotaxis response regulator CheV